MSCDYVRLAIAHPLAPCLSRAHSRVRTCLKGVARVCSKQRGKSRDFSARGTLSLKGADEVPTRAGVCARKITSAHEFAREPSGNQAKERSIPQCRMGA